MKKRRAFFRTVAIGFGAWLPILGVVQVYLLIGSWFNTPVNELLRIPIINLLFAQAPALRFLQHVLGVFVVLVLILVVFFLSGSFVLTWAGKRLRHLVEMRLLRFLPLYNFFKKIVVLFAGEDGDGSFLTRFENTAFVHIYGNSTFVTALVTAGHDSGAGICTAYVPAVPNVTAGRLYNVPVAWVHFLEIPPGDLVAAVAAWGLGTEKLITRFVQARLTSQHADIPECFLNDQCPLQREVVKERARICAAMP